MQVKESRLFAGVIVIGVLVISILSIDLLRRRPQIVQTVTIVHKLHRKPLQLDHVSTTRSLQNISTAVSTNRSALYDNNSTTRPPWLTTSLPLKTTDSSSSSISTASTPHQPSHVPQTNKTVLAANSEITATAQSSTQSTNLELSSTTLLTTSEPQTRDGHLLSVSTPAPPPPHRSGGYVLAENYYEQQTMGLRNMMQLQCWGQSLKLKVVKPVTHDSFLRTPLDSGQQTHFLKFEDSFDEQEWSHRAERLGYAPLCPYSEFLTEAPRDVVLVRFEHPLVSTVKERQRSGKGIFHSPTSLRYTTGCSDKWPTNRDLLFLKTNGFQVVRNVCFNFYFGDQLSLDTFNQHILGSLSSDSVTIIFQIWRGISTAQRVLLKDVCQNTALVQEHIPLSSRLTQQADQYIHKYLRGSGDYLAIMGRLEISQLTVHKKVPVVPYCLDETLNQWRKFKPSSKVDQTFLSIDIGRYGSKKYRSGLPTELGIAFNKFFQTLFGTSLTQKEWEKRFELVAGTRDAGYIALLQKVLVTRAKCILFVGGGAFQRHALYLYKTLHPDPKDQCYQIVKQCTRSNKLG